MTDDLSRRAAALGFPKLKYAWVERERRWLCDQVPADRVLWAERITDIYAEGARLRLREARRLDGNAVMRRLTKKADLDEGHRLITSIYLDEAEFALLAALPGRRLVKVRHHLADAPRAAAFSVDRFEGALDGLVLAEAEFESDEDMAAFDTPNFAVREVTADARYNGGALAWAGLPGERTAT